MSFVSESTPNGRRYSGPKRTRHSYQREDIQWTSKTPEDEDSVEGVTDSLVIDSLKDELKDKDIKLEETVQENRRLKDLLAEKEHELDEEKRNSSRFMDRIKFTVSKVRTEMEAKLAVAEDMADEQQNQLEDQIKSLNIERVKLKRQRMYFHNANQLNKQKFIGRSVTAIKQKYLYYESMRRLKRTALSSGERLIKELKEATDKVYRRNRKEQVQGMVTIVTDLGEESRQIEAAEERVVKKRPDGRVQCTECVKTFGDTKDLIRHLTVKHKMNVNDRSKNPDPDDD